MIGIKQAIRFCENGNVFVNSDSVVDWANREFEFQRGGPPRPIPLLDTRNGRIAGVQVRDLSRPIEDERTREEIINAIKKISFNVKYDRNMRPGYIQSKNTSFQTILADDNYQDFFLNSQLYTTLFFFINIKRFEK